MFWPKVHNVSNFKLEIYWNYFSLMMTARKVWQHWKLYSSRRPGSWRNSEIQNIVTSDCDGYLRDWLNLCKFLKYGFFISLIPFNNPTHFLPDSFRLILMTSIRATVSRNGYSTGRKVCFDIHPYFCQDICNYCFLFIS